MNERRHIHTARIPVRWIDQDTFGHVNNATYFTYFEQTRVDWLATLNVDWQRGVGPVVVHAECDYKRPITYPALLEITMLSEPPGRSSFHTYYEIRVEGDPDTVYAVGKATMVWVDVQKGRPVSLPDEIRHALAGLPDPASTTTR